MSARFQCLNASRQIMRQKPSIACSFSSSACVRADEGSSAARLLAQTGSSESPSNSGPQTANVPKYKRFSNLIDRTPMTRRIEVGNEATHGVLMQTLMNGKQKKAERPELKSAAEVLENNTLAKDLNKQVARRWKVGDVYAPHDLSPVEMQKWRKRAQPTMDVFDALDMNPIDEYKNFSLLTQFMTPMGRIKHGLENGLRKVNQRRIAKAIRRSIGLGLMPSVHKHPELLHKERRRRSEALMKDRSYGFNSLR